VKLVSKLIVVFDRALDYMAVFAGFLIIFAMTSVSVAIATRYLGHPISWVFEVSQYILLYTTFLVAAWILRKDAHVKIDIVLNQLNPRIQSLINTITSAISLIVCFVLTWYGVKTTWDTFQAGYFTLSILEPPLYIFIAIIPVGFFLLVIQLLRRTYGYFRSWRASPDKEQGSRANHQFEL